MGEGARVIGVFRAMCTCKYSFANKARQTVTACSLDTAPMVAYKMTRARCECMHFEKGRAQGTMGEGEAEKGGGRKQRTQRAGHHKP